MPEPITLEFLARQQQRILDKWASMGTQCTLMQDDVRSLTMRAIRQGTASRNSPDPLHRKIDRGGRLENAAAES